MCPSRITMSDTFPTEYRPLDYTIGGALVVCVVVGVVGNVAAVVYFWGRRRESLPDLLYSLISSC